MSLRDLFWLLAGSMTTVVAVFIARGILRGRTQQTVQPSLRARALTLLATIAIAATVVGIYLWSGNPVAIDGIVAIHPAGAPAAPADSLEEATRGLSQRLQAGGGSAADWELLAQSYEYLGRSDEARQARAAATRNGAPTVSPVDPSIDQRHVAELARAGSLRRARDFAGARDVYARLAEQGSLSADAWADYADVVASLQGGSLSGEPARYVAAALRLNPEHVKALWLDASLAHEQRRYADALAGWRKLKSVLPADSPDQAIIDGNVMEAARLGQVKAPARITGTVELAPGLAARAPVNATLFIYAKRPTASGPPLAVVRLPASGWPVAFVLDDSSTMLTGAGLSDGSLVRVEARISASGNALPQRGDLIGSVVDIDPGSGRPVHIAIDREIS